MPYRDPAQGAAWMREYRKRKRAGKTGAPATLPCVPSVAVHQSLRRCPRKQLAVQVPRPRFRRPCPCEKLFTAVSRPRCNWRERFLSGSSPPRRARIAITPDTVRPARRAVIVEVERNESAAKHPPTKGLL